MLAFVAVFVVAVVVVLVVEVVVVVLAVFVVVFVVIVSWPCSVCICLLALLLSVDCRTLLYARGGRPFMRLPAHFICPFPLSPSFCTARTNSPRSEHAVA